MSTPEQKCISSPEQNYINDAGKKDAELGAFRPASDLVGIIPFVKHRTAGGTQSRGRTESGAVWLDFAPSDKVMQIENDYEKEVYNGDIGRVDDVDTNAGELIAQL